MPRKTRKAQMVQNQETTTQTSEEDQMEVTNNMTEESTPATIVESSESEIFATQTEGQEAEGAANTSEGENHLGQSSVVANAGEASEQPSPAKKERVSKRPYISLVEEYLELGNLDKKELLALIMKRFPTTSKNGVSTFLSDALNPRYSHWKDRVVSKTIDGKLIFADKIEPVQEAGLSEVQAETPAE